MNCKAILQLQNVNTKQLQVLNPSLHSSTVLAHSTTADHKEILLPASPSADHRLVFLLQQFPLNMRRGLVLK